MRGLRGRRGVAAALAVTAGVLVLAASTAVVLALTVHRPPPAIAVGTRPLTGPSRAVAVSPAAPSTDATAAPTPTAPPPAPPPVRVDENSGAITVRVGTLVDVELHGGSGGRWAEPGTPTPQLLERLSGSATPDGNAAATFRAVAPGDGVITVERSTPCSSGPSGGVCAVEARRISVTVTR